MSTDTDDLSKFHNPAKLTEWGQSDDWRLLTVEEITKQPLPDDAEYWCGDWLSSGARGEYLNELTRDSYTYRTRKPLPSQSSDDISYYEHDLPKIIAGVRRGEKWEYNYKWEKAWVAPQDQSQESLKGYILNLAYRVRLAPVPVVKWWDCGEDLPAAVVWIRWKTEPRIIFMPIRMDGLGMWYLGYSQVASIVKWDRVNELEHSIDLRNWKPCVKPEGGK